MLKKGVRVMYLVNNGSLVNGSLGMIVDWEPQAAASPYPVHPVFHSIDDGKSIIIAPLLCCDDDHEDDVFTCLPLILAEALSIHKSMGATLPSVIVDCGSPAAPGGKRRRGMFAPNQLLVAVSRVRSSDFLAVKHYQRGSARIPGDAKFCKNSQIWMQRLEGHSRSQADAVRSFLASLDCLGNAPTSGSPRTHSQDSDQVSGEPAPATALAAIQSQRTRVPQVPTNNDSGGPVPVDVVFFLVDNEDGSSTTMFATSVTPISTSNRSGSCGKHHSLHSCIAEFRTECPRSKTSVMLYLFEGTRISPAEAKHTVLVVNEDYIELLPGRLVEKGAPIHIDVVQGTPIPESKGSTSMWSKGHPSNVEAPDDSPQLDCHSSPGLLDCLAPCVWLHDEVVNSYTQMLRWALMSRGINDVLVFDSFFFTKLWGDGFEGVKRWTRNMLLHKLSGCPCTWTVFHHRLILLPVHSASHWTWILVDFENIGNIKITYYDSSMTGRFYVKAKEFCDKVIEWLRLESRDKRFPGGELYVCAIDVFPTDMPQQNNGYDCAMFMLLTMSRKALRCALADVVQGTISSHRILLRRILETGRPALSEPHYAQLAFGDQEPPAAAAVAAAAAEAATIGTQVGKRRRPAGDSDSDSEKSMTTEEIRETFLAQARKERQTRKADEGRSSRAAEARRSYDDLAFPYKLWHDMSGDERDACFSSKEHPEGLPVVSIWTGPRQPPLAAQNYIAASFGISVVPSETLSSLSTEGGAITAEQLLVLLDHTQLDTVGDQLVDFWHFDGGRDTIMRRVFGVSSFSELADLIECRSRPFMSEHKVCSELSWPSGASSLRGSELLREWFVMARAAVEFSLPTIRCRDAPPCCVSDARWCVRSQWEALKLPRLACFKLCIEWLAESLDSDFVPTFVGWPKCTPRSKGGCLCDGRSFWACSATQLSQSVGGQLKIPDVPDGTMTSDLKEDLAITRGFRKWQQTVKTFNVTRGNARVRQPGYSTHPLWCRCFAAAHDCRLALINLLVDEATFSPFHNHLLGAHAGLKSLLGLAPSGPLDSDDEEPTGQKCNDADENGHAAAPPPGGVLLTSCAPCTPPSPFALSARCSPFASHCWPRAIRWPRLSPSARRWGCPAPKKGLLPPVHRVAAADSSEDAHDGDGCTERRTSEDAHSGGGGGGGGTGGGGGGSGGRGGGRSRRNSGGSVGGSRGG